MLVYLHFKYIIVCVVFYYYFSFFNILRERKYVKRLSLLDANSSSADAGWETINFEGTIYTET